jgi:hypothetical protein
MIKNIILGGLLIIPVLFWIKVDPERTAPDNPDIVVIEYKCSELFKYNDTPEEVTDECRIKAEKATNNKK